MNGDWASSRCCKASSAVASSRLTRRIWYTPRACHDPDSVPGNSRADGPCAVPRTSWSGSCSRRVISRRARIRAGLGCAPQAPSAGDRTSPRAARELGGYKCNGRGGPAAGAERHAAKGDCAAGAGLAIVARCLSPSCGQPASCWSRLLTAISTWRSSSIPIQKCSATSAGERGRRQRSLSPTRGGWP
jgi:hypothetical protein